MDKGTMNSLRGSSTDENKKCSMRVASELAARIRNFPPINRADAGVRSRWRPHWKFECWLLTTNYDRDEQNRPIFTMSYAPPLATFHISANEFQLASSEPLSDNAGHFVGEFLSVDGGREGVVQTVIVRPGVPV